MCTYYNNLLKVLKVKDSERAGMLLMFDDFEFFKRYSKIKNSQVGGADMGPTSHIINAEFNIENDTYNFKVFMSESVDNETISYAIHNNDDDTKDNKCMLIFYEKKYKFCYLHTVSYHNKCTLNMPHEGGGTLMFKFALEFIENYVRPKYKVKYIQLRDNSTKICKQIKESIKLDSLKMLTTGETWYGNYGFVPFDNYKIKTDKAKMKNYKDNQRIVKTTLVKNTNVEKYMKKAITKFETPINNAIIQIMVQEYYNDSIMNLLKNLMEVYETGCGIFYYIYEQLMMDLNMVDLHGTVYWKKLN